MKRTPTILLIPFMLAACSSSPEKSSTYVSPTYYETYTCSQMTAEKQRLDSQIDQAAAANKQGQLLDAAVTIYAISQGMGMSKGDNTELARLQNRMTVLEETMIRKDCQSVPTNK